MGKSVLGVPIARLVPWLVLALGIATTAFLYLSIDRALRTRRLAEFDREADRVVRSVRGALDRQVSVLHATAGAVAIDPKMTQERFATFYDHLALGEDARIPEAIGLSLLRPWERRGELAQEASERGVRRYALRPAGPRPEAHAVMLLMPLDEKNQPAPGYDMHAEPVRAQAMDRSRRMGQAVMTSKVFLAKDLSVKIPSFIVYLPVTNPRTGGLAGFVYSGIHAERLLQHAFDDDPQAGNVGLQLWTGEPSEANLVYSRMVGGRLPYDRSLDIDLPHVARTLRARIVATPDFGTAAVIQRWVLPVGSVLSGLLFALAGLLRRAHEESERREAEQTLLAEVGRLTAREPDSDATLGSIAAQVSSTLGAVCRIDVLEEEGTLRTVSTRKEGCEALEALQRDFPRLEYDVLLREALATGVTQRAVGYPAVNEAHRARLAAYAVGPVLVVPLRAAERPVGAITVTRRVGETPFGPDAANLAESIAGRLALAVENARLYHDLERRVVERTRDLEASNHELESFCYSVSHDLRTPLRSLDGFGRALEEDYGDRLDAQGLDFIARIRAATRRMDELITALLTLSRLTRREIVPTEVDVSAMVRDVLQDLDPEGKVEADVQEGVRVNADPRMLAVALDNLLSNAIKFSSRTERPRIVVGMTVDGELSVRDNGAGFDMAYAGKLFQPFERLHSVREFPGHGIGLATVERIVRRHGGEVRAEGVPGEGATFFMRFPG